MDDSISSSLKTSDLLKNMAPDNSQQSPGHQGGNSTGGKSENLRVLYIRNLTYELNYESLSLIGKKFGVVERLRLKIGQDNTFDAYVVFNNKESAENAHAKLNGYIVNDLALHTKLFDINNLKEDPNDYYPETSTPVIVRESPEPVWFVAHYKPGNDNYAKASESLEKTLNGIPPQNIKKYGKNILIKAKNMIQSKILQSFKPLENSNLDSVSVHKFFNEFKGVIYSKDLHAYTENEILHRSPNNVYKVTKLKGTNNVILLYFSSEYIPDYISFGNHVRVRVRRFKPSPRQCKSCFEYGHAREKCEQSQKCPNCSSIHETVTKCNKDAFCFLCGGKHSPLSNECPRKKLEREIIETADIERISIGNAKRKVMGANKNENSTYANAINKMKTTTWKIPQGTNNAQSLKRNPNMNPRDDASTSSASETITSSASETSTTKTKLDKNLQSRSDARADSEGFWLPPNHKRCRQSSPNKNEIEISNRYSALDPFSPMITPQPFKKMALSASCSDLHTKTDAVLLTSSPSEECISSYSKIKESDDIQMDTDNISPSPIIGNTIKPLVCPPEQRKMKSDVETTFDEINPSPIIGNTGNSHIVNQTSSENISHNASCGCHNCFLDQLKKLKQISATSLTNVINSFVKYKVKNQNGDLGKHSADCMCVDHLIKQRTSSTLSIENLLEKIKQKQKTQGAITKRLNTNIKSSGKKPPPEQGSLATKSSRSNALLDRNSPPQ